MDKKDHEALNGGRLQGLGSVVRVPVAESGQMEIGGQLMPTASTGQIRCLDCGGWPIPGGAIFIPVAHCKDGTDVSNLPIERWHEFQKATGAILTPVPSVGFICELCLVWRLQRRADIVSRTSTPRGYYAFNHAKRILREKAEAQRVADKRTSK